MANGNDRTPVFQNEDWWACLIGWFILLIAIIGVHEVAAGKWAVSILPAAPKLGKWTELSAAFPKGFGATIGTGLMMWAFLCVLMLIAGYFLKFDLKSFVPGFFVLERWFYA